MTTVGADTSVLDNAAWQSLTGPHARFAERHGDAVRYPAAAAPFHALADPADPRAWAVLTGPGAEVAVAGGVPDGPPGWELADRAAGVQLIDVALRAEPDPEVVPLTADDVPEILDLVERTQPGPFRSRTIELGTEISTVCTDPAHRRQGLATRLVRAVAAGIRDRGETPFLHTSAANAAAIRLYESIGLRLRRRTTFGLYRHTGATPAKG